MGESPEIKNWKSLWTSLSDAKIGQIWVYHVARVLGEETVFKVCNWMAVKLLPYNPVFLFSRLICVITSADKKDLRKALTGKQGSHTF